MRLGLLSYYTLLSVILISNLFAMHLQHLAAKLGINHANLKMGFTPNVDLQVVVESYTI